MKKQSKQQEAEVYTAEDLISRGGYITSMDVFWNHLYKIFPELTNKNLLIKMTYRKSTEEEKNNFLDRVLCNERNALFRINHLKEEGFVRAEHEMFCDKFLIATFGNEPFGILEVKDRTDYVVDLEWIYYNYEL